MVCSDNPPIWAIFVRGAASTIRRACIGQRRLWLIAAFCAGFFGTNSEVQAGPLEEGLAAYGAGTYALAMQTLLPLAESGNPVALVTMGDMYVRGQGVVYDYEKAMGYYTKASAAGSYDAVAEIGNLYRNAFGVDQDYAKAVEMFREAAQHGSLRGESYLGEMYASGQGIPVDYEKAISLFSHAADHGLVVASVNLGNLYLSGRGVPKDIPTAVRYYGAAIEQNSPQAMNNLALVWQKGLGMPKNPEDALNLFEKAGRLGESSGAYNAGWAFENGIGTDQDLIQAFKWYEIGASEGGKLSAHRRDLLSTQLSADEIQTARRQEPSYLSGDSTADAQSGSSTSNKAVTAQSANDGYAAYNRGEFAAALAIWSPLAANGDADAQTGLCGLFGTGKGVPENYDTAVYWCRRAADQNNAIAEEFLGAMYEVGNGVTKDLTIAAEWLEKSAEQGNPFAQHRLGTLYEKGLGVVQDYAMAEKWYAQAAATFAPSDAQNRDEAAKDRDRITALLSPQASPSQSQSSPNSLTLVATGSGFYLSANGEFLTNYHVVKECKEVSVLDIRTVVKSTDPQNDLALLIAPKRLGDVATLRSGPPVRAGERVVAVGFPLAGYLAEQANVTIGDVSSLAGIGNDSRFLQITAPVQPGNSGGPLFDASGNVIGVVSAKIDAIKIAGVTGDIPENVNFAINVSVVKSFLDAQGLTYRTGVSDTDRPAADIGDVGKNITELVKCWQ